MHIIMFDKKGNSVPDIKLSQFTYFVHTGNKEFWCPLTPTRSQILVLPVSVILKLIVYNLHIRGVLSSTMSTMLNKFPYINVQSIYRIDSSYYFFLLILMKIADNSVWTCVYNYWVYFSWCTVDYPIICSLYYWLLQDMEIAWETSKCIPA